MGNSASTKNWIFLDRHGRKHLAQLTHCTSSKQRIAFLDGQQLWNDREQLHRGDEFSFDVEGTAGIIRMAKKRGKQSYTLRFGQSLVPHSEPTWVEYCLTHDGSLPDPVYEKELFPRAQPHGKASETADFFQEDDSVFEKPHKRKQTKRTIHKAMREHQTSKQHQQAQVVTQMAVPALSQFKTEAVSSAKALVQATPAVPKSKAHHSQFETGPSFSPVPTPKRNAAPLPKVQQSQGIVLDKAKPVPVPCQPLANQPGPQSLLSQSQYLKKPELESPCEAVLHGAVLHGLICPTEKKRRAEPGNVIKKQKSDWEHVATFLADDVFEFPELPEEQEQFIPLPQLPLCDDSLLDRSSPDIFHHTQDDIFMSFGNSQVAPC